MAAAGDRTRDERRAELIEEAAGALVERGVEATRFRDVAERAGVSVGLLQHYFGSRDALIEAAIEAVAAKKLARLRDVGAGTDDPWRLIRAAIDEVLATDDPVGDARSWLDVCAAASGRPHVGVAIERVQERWVALIERALVEGATRGEFRLEMEPRQAARAVNALIDGMELALAAEGVRSRDDAEAARELTARAAWLLVGGVGEPPA